MNVIVISSVVKAAKCYRDFDFLIIKRINALLIANLQ